MILISHQCEQRLVFSFCVLLFSASPLAQTPPTAAPHHYKIVELPLKPMHIANTGEIVGTDEHHAAAIWSERKGLRPLPAVKGFPRSEPASSNRLGQVVGSLMPADDSSSRAFIYADGKITPLGGDRGKATAINDSGQITGQTLVKGKVPIAPVIWQKGNTTDLGGCCGGVGRAINNHGQVVGDMYDEEGRYHAFLWDRQHGLLQLVAPENYSTAIAINDSGHALVQDMEKGFFIYAGKDKLTWLDISKRQPNPRAMNNSDVVVGAFGPYFDAYRAFIWDKTNGFHDLNDLIPANSGWKLQYATWINDAGEIVGVGDHNENEDVGFLLTEESGEGHKAGESQPGSAQK